jgi:hypothetical protein
MLSFGNNSAFVEFWCLWIQEACMQTIYQQQFEKILQTCEAVMCGKIQKVVYNVGNTQFSTISHLETYSNLNISKLLN